MPRKGSPYDRRWQALRLAHLAAEPLCRRCAALGRTTAGAHVDHIVTVAEAPDRRLDQANLQTLCEACHNGWKTPADRRGFDTTIGVDGWPIDDRHPANST